MEEGGVEKELAELLVDVLLVPAHPLSAPAARAAAMTIDIHMRFMMVLSFEHGTYGTGAI